MKILYAISEAGPFVKTGGLGDVGASFPPALSGLGASVCAVLPLYEAVGQEWRAKMRLVKSFQVSLSWRNQYCGVFELKYSGVTWYFLDNEYYFKRNGLYGHYDDGERFAFFSKAVIALIKELDLKPDIVHCNDWQTALIPIYLRCLNDESLAGIRSVFTIHNIEYQGQFGRDILREVFDLPEDLFTSGKLEYKGGVSLMKGALNFADLITTVSPTYARELTYAYYAHGLDGVILENAHKLHGILNGIDQELYNPGTDRLIEANYRPSDLSGKKADKLALQKLTGLEKNPDAPIFAVVSRLVSHKGMDLITARLDALMSREIQFVLLGSGDPAYEQAFRNAQERFPGRFSANITFSNSLAHQIYAGADILLMPSQAEPCGLSQMIAMRYGTIPVVRETGGLRDSVPPYNEGGGGAGFTFFNYNADDMTAAADRALALYRDKEAWKKLMIRDMTTDLSWGKSALEYEKLYEKLSEIQGI